MNNRGQWLLAYTNVQRQVMRQMLALQDRVVLCYNLMLPGGSASRQRGLQLNRPVSC